MICHTFKEEIKLVKTELCANFETFFKQPSLVKISVLLSYK